MIEQSNEKSKDKSYSIQSIIQKMDGYVFRFDNSVQREAGQWALKPKGNLISDILQNNPVPNLTFAEQVKDGVVITWNLDGKQRCSTVYDFYNNKFRISRAIRRWEIEYQGYAKDVNGEKIFSKDGYPKFEKKTFDIRGKKYSDLPQELKDRFLDYTFGCTLYLNCSDKDIEYHICRYNDGKPMSQAQKGMGVLGTDFSRRVKEISAMAFFKDCGDYRQSEFRNGTIDKIVVEGLMASYYLDNWNKNDAMCAFLKENGSNDDFDNFAELVGRLEEVVSEDIADMFTSRDTFIWFASFSRFAKFDGLEDTRFVEFLSEFKNSLHSKEYNGTTYDTINDCRNTKDKSIVIAKLDHIEGLMKEYFHIGSAKVDLTEQFIVDTVGIDEDDVDLELYSQTLDDLEDRVVDSKSNLLDKKNRLSLLAMTAYGYKNDVDLEPWFEDYATRNNTYLTNQKANYLHMVEDFEGNAAQAA